LPGPNPVSITGLLSKSPTPSGGRSGKDSSLTLPPADVEFQVDYGMSIIKSMKKGRLFP